MSNILMIPASGSIIFDSQSANSSVISPLSSAPRLSYDNGGGLNITSYTTGTTTLDRFSVDGSAGRLFSISDSLTGTIFSVNDAAGLPIIQVDSDTTDIVNIGPYGTSTFVTSGTSVGIGTAAPISKLHIVDRALAATGGLSGSILNLEQTWNTSGTPTAIKLNVTDTASNAASNLIDLQLGSLNRFTVRKNGVTTISSIDGGGGDPMLFLKNQYGTIGVTVGGGARLGFSYNGPEFLSYFQGAGLSLQGYLNLGAGVFLHRDGADNIFAQRNGVNPQAFRLYNTYTSSTNFERLNLRWISNEVKIGTEKGSAGGVARDLVFETDGTERARITAAGLFSVNGISFGRGGGNNYENIAIGLNSLSSNQIGFGNIAIGLSALNASESTNNIAIGLSALSYLLDGDSNIVLGTSAGLSDRYSGDSIYLTSCIFIGKDTKPDNGVGDSNSIIIGDQAIGMGSNTAVFGNDSTTNTYLKGVVQVHRSASDPSNYERIAMRWNGTTGTLGTSQLGTGSARPLALETSGTPRMTIGATGDITFSNPTQVRTALGFVQLTPSAYANLVASGIANPDTIYIVQE